LHVLTEGAVLRRVVQFYLRFVRYIVFLSLGEQKVPLVEYRLIIYSSSCERQCKANCSAAINVCVFSQVRLALTRENAALQCMDEIFLFDKLHVEGKSRYRKKLIAQVFSLCRATDFDVVIVISELQ
jgi:hypothetical protein